MKLLAIHYGHNCTVALSVGGVVVCVLSEERICRIKNATGFPFQALQYVVDHYLDGSLDNADRIAIIDGTGLGAAYLLHHGLEPKRFLDYYWKSKDRLWKRITVSGPLKLAHRLRAKISTALRKSNLSDAHEKILKQIRINGAKVTFLDHHSCHAATAAYFSPVSDGGRWLVLTMDGEGDGLSSTVNVIESGSLTRVHSNSNAVSLGYLYAETTAYMGMKANEHEFKLMGMAPYADPAQVERLTAELSKVIGLDDKGQFWTSVPAFEFLPLLSKMFAFERFDVIAGAVQSLTERLVCQWAEYWIAKTGIGNVAVSGGVFMNVKAAKRLAESPAVDRMFVVPSASDESLPIGALCLLAHEAGQEITPVQSLYLGRGFGKDYIESVISRDGLQDAFEIERFESDEALAERVAGLLAENEIVARCCGREEWGARALGNRSILCNPSNFQNIERLNGKVKCRDFWMPFTPSILSEEMGRYVSNPKRIDSPYMALTFDSTDSARRAFAAAIHPRDFTMRPQAVYKEWNPGYHLLISKFAEKTGIYGLLNTSFNLHGEPNVSTPEDAVRTVLNSGLDWLLLGHVLMHKKTGA